MLVADVNPRTMVVDRRTAERCGVVGQGVLQRQIVLLKEPPNAPSTTIALKGSSNPARRYRGVARIGASYQGNGLTLALRVDLYETTLPAYRRWRTMRIVANAG